VVMVSMMQRARRKLVGRDGVPIRKPAPTLLVKVPPRYGGFSIECEEFR
jgi:hypothetical protein